MSSSRAEELSHESDVFQNGVFSEQILRALTSDVADTTPKDGWVSLTELRAFVASTVPRETADRQHPVVDRDNLAVQFGFPLAVAGTSAAPRPTAVQP
jgi:uncharacterized caspase-like protein